MKGASQDCPEVLPRGLFVIVPLSLCTGLFADLSRGLSVQLRRHFLVNETVPARGGSPSLLAAVLQ